MVTLHGTCFLHLLNLISVVVAVISCYNNAHNNQPNEARELILGILIAIKMINSIAKLFMQIHVGCRLTANENHHRLFL